MNHETHGGLGSKTQEKLVAGNGQASKQDGGRSGNWMAAVEPWPRPVDGAELLAEMEGLLRRHVVLPKWAPETLALWVLHTYAFQFREVSTYLGIESPEKRCGKTTLLAVLSELVNRPVVAANISSPAFFRVIEETQPTLLIDEADTFIRGNDELRGILNSGYSRKTAFVVRVAAREGLPQWESGPPAVRPSSEAKEKPGTRLARFSCWCPKAVAAIGRLPDTLADRCIVIRMQRKAAGEACERLRNLEGAELRQRSVRWVLDHELAIARAQPVLPKGINDRAADIWEPLLALAELAGGDWPQRAQAAAEGLTASSQEQNPIASLLLDIFLSFALQERPRMFSRSLVDCLNSHSDRPWGEMKQGKAITEIWLARQLRGYGIRPKTVWIGEISGKGYEQEDFRDVFRRYIPPAEIEAWKREWIGGKEQDLRRGVACAPIPR